MKQWALNMQPIFAIAVLIAVQNINGLLATEKASTHWTDDVLRPMAEYIKFRNQYPRKFKSEQEMRDRYENFKQTLKRIDASNKQANRTLYGITEFADWYSYELEKFKANILLNDFVFRGPSSQFLRRYIPTGNPIRKQFSWLAFATGSRIQYGRTIHLSDDELIDCDTNNNHCVSGSTKRGFIRGRDIGYKLQENYNPSQECPKSWDIKLGEIYSFPKTNPHDTMADFIINHGPVAVSIAWPPLMFSYSGFGIIRGSACGQHSKPEHAVVLLGFGEENGVKYWILKNSYGKRWGTNGYFRLERGVNACLVESYPIAASLKRSKRKLTSKIYS